MAGGGGFPVIRKERPYKKEISSISRNIFTNIKKHTPQPFQAFSHNIQGDEYVNGDGVHRLL